MAPLLKSSIQNELKQPCGFCSLLAAQSIRLYVTGIHGEKKSTLPVGSFQMRYLLAILCVLVVAVAQVFYGGALRPVFALPAFALAGVVALQAVWSPFWKNIPAPSMVCVISVLVLGGWLAWREINSPDVWLAAGYLRLTLACMVMYLIFASVITNPYHRLAFVAGLLMLALAQAAVGIWQAAHSHTGFPLPWFSEQLRLWYSRRFVSAVHGFYLNRNQLAWFLNSAGLMALTITCWGRWKVAAKVLCLYVALLSFACAVLTGSRGGGLGLAAGFSAFCVLSGVVLVVGAGSRRWIAVMAMLAGLASTAGTVWYVFASNFFVRERFAMLVEDNYRGEVFSFVLRQIQREPWLGTGAGTFMYFARQFREVPLPMDDIFAHNDWMQLGADFGVPAIVILFFVIIFHVMNGLQGLTRILRQRMTTYSRPQSHAAALIIGSLSCLAAYAVHSFFDFNMQIPANALVAAALLGMLANTGGADAGYKGRKANLLVRIPLAFVLVACGAWLLICTWRSAGPEYYWLRAENAVLSGDWKRGAEEARKGLQYSYFCPGLHNALGESLLLENLAAPSLQERWPLVVAAGEEFSNALEYGPMNWDSRVRKVRTLIKTGRLRSAESEVVQAIQLYPSHGEGYYLYGIVLEKSGRQEEALRMYSIFRSLPRDASTDREAAQRIELIRQKLPQP